MNINNLKEAQKIISKEVSDNIKTELNTKEFSLLCQISGNIKLLIDRIENPNKWKNIDRELNRL